MPDALEILREDHRKVQDLFKELTDTEDTDRKKQIAETVLNDLEVHAALEEEIFYPAVRERIEAELLMDQALEEHHVAKFLMEELEYMDPEDERYDAKFRVLAESVRHHINEEENELFPKALETGMDFQGLGEELTERKQELIDELQQAAARPKSGRKARAGGGGRAKGKTATKKSGPSKSRYRRAG